MLYVNVHVQTYSGSTVAFANPLLSTRYQPHVAADVPFHTDVQPVCSGSDYETWPYHWAVSVSQADFKMSSLAPWRL